MSATHDRPAPLRPLPLAAPVDAPPGSIDALDRRRFLQLLGASLALAGLSGCEGRQAPELIVPYTRQPEHVIPGRPLFFATQLLFEGWARGVLVESHEGRPTKVEGNPDHPASLGGTDAIMQAEVLGVYDPARSQAVRLRGEVASKAAFQAACAAWREEARGRRGRGLRVLTSPTTSPTLLRLLGELLGELPEARWHTHAAVGHEHALAGARLAFGEELLAVPHVARADVIVALDCDLLGGLPGSPRHARDLADRRRLRRPDGLRMNRLYAVEPTPTITGGSADHALPLARGDVEPFLVELARALGLAAPTRGRLPAHAREWVEPLARDLGRAGQAALLCVGEAQPPRVHALAHALQEHLGAAGLTTSLVPTPPSLHELRPGSLDELVRDLEAGEVEWLFVLDTNPVYDAPADLDVGRALEAAATTVHVGTHVDETARRCQWHLPLAHALERWGDARAFDLTPGLLQPLITPLWGGVTEHEVLALLAGRAQATGRELVRETWRAGRDDATFEPWWREALRRGVIPGGAPAPRSPRVDHEAVRAAFDPGASGASGTTSAGASPGEAPLGGPPAEHPPEEVAGLELAFQPDPRVWDGRWATNAWLRELPDPVTTLSWTPAALVSPALARRLGLEHEDVLRLTARGRALEAPVLVVPGQADETVTLRLGHGRQGAGPVTEVLGYDAYRVRPGGARWRVDGLVARRTGRAEPLTVGQRTERQHDRHLARSGTIHELRAGAETIATTILEKYHLPDDRSTPSLFHDAPITEGAPQWGMLIDLTTCIGCGACTAACQAENNIPVVGQELVRKGYAMHWIRIDRYVEGPVARPELQFQPVPCMHCETAPCELVCPTGATQHSHDGLNEMIYNRCVGTRYCSNNCPYKVRRFNFLDFVGREGGGDLAALQRNPDVSVRGLGVMEKCTYCVQRIRQGGIAAERAGRPLRDGEVITACQGACPTRAIVFGDIADPDARVSQARQAPHHYAMLSELNTRPRTTYLARIRNKNPDLEGAP